MIQDIINIEEQKISDLTIISDEQKQIILKSIKYTTIPYMPITKGFMTSVILNDGEFPLLESKVSQAAIEMKSRFNQIVEAQYNYNKDALEIEEIQLDITDIKNSDKSEDRKTLEIRKKNLDLQMKNYRIMSVKTSIKTLFDEFKNWKETVDLYVEQLQKIDPSIKSIDDINFNKIREEEIKIKYSRMMKMASEGMQLSQSQENFLVNMSCNKPPQLLKG